MTPDDRAARRAQDLAMMRDSSRWPYWPILPLKRYGALGQADHGFLWAEGGLRIFAREALDDSTAIDQLPYETFASLEAMLDAGWTVD